MMCLNQIAAPTVLDRLVPKPKLSVTFPWPSAKLFPNSKNGRHYLTSLDAKVSARGAGLFYTRQAMKQCGPIELGAREPMAVTFRMPNRTRRDMDGMHGAIKHYIDGMAQALGVDDSIFRPVRLDDAIDPSKKGCVVIEIGEVE